MKIDPLVSKACPAQTGPFIFGPRGSRWPIFYTLLEVVTMGSTNISYVQQHHNDGNLLIARLSRSFSESKCWLYVREAHNIYVTLITLGELIWISYHINASVHELILIMSVLG